MFKRLVAAILLVENMERSVAFYRDTLGMKIKGEFPDWIEFVTESRSAVLALHPKRTKSTRSTNMLIGFNVGDIEYTCKELENKNVRFYKKLTEESFGKHAIIEDPDGHLISIAEIPAKDELGQIPYYHGFAPIEGLT
jgi:catechol 2,3-dioxygenase-like lactoylglutathione lyase family enzyme